MGTVVKKNQVIDVKDAVRQWMKRDPKSAEAIIYGVGPQERHTPYRLEKIMQAYEEGKEDRLPPIRYAPQFGEVEDGRHRLAAAFLMGKDKIKADLVYVTDKDEEEEEDWWED